MNKAADTTLPYLKSGAQTASDVASPLLKQLAPLFQVRTACSRDSFRLHKHAAELTWSLLLLVANSEVQQPDAAPNQLDGPPACRGGVAEAERFLNAQGLNLNSAAVVDTKGWTPKGCMSDSMQLTSPARSQGGVAEAERFLNAQGLNLDSAAVVDTKGWTPKGCMSDSMQLTSPARSQGGVAEAERFLNAQGLNLNSAAVVDTTRKAQDVAGDAYVQGKPFINQALDTLTTSSPGKLGQYALIALGVYYLVCPSRLLLLPQTGMHWLHRRHSFEGRRLASSGLANL